MPKQISSLFSLASLLGIAFLIASPSGSAAEDAPEGGRNQTFVISAYYSPLPDQTHYLRGNYEAEIKLNGRGTNGADGTEVYPGMLAAPKTYPFGTRIYIPDLGIGTVHDRGGAIVSGADYDRIDVWMGKGEEGLARALQWGMRRIEGIVYENAENIAENFSFDHLPARQSVLTQLQGLFPKNLDEGQVGAEVQKLQEHLAALGFFNGPSTGVYDATTKEAVFAFQKSVHLVSSLEDYGAGTFGPKTRASLEKQIAKKDPAANSKPGETEPLRKTAFLPERAEKGDSGPKIKRLQIILKALGYFRDEYSESYGPQTAAAVLAFQKDQGLVGDEESPGAGIFGPKTHSKLAQALETRAQARRKFAARRATLTLDEHTNPDQALAFSSESILKPGETLVPGDRNAAVKKLQENLIAFGFLPQGSATGFYGDMTKAAVFKLQQKYSLVPNEEAPWAGQFGSKTEAALFQEAALS